MRPKKFYGYFIFFIMFIIITWMLFPIINKRCLTNEDAKSDYNNSTEWLNISLHDISDETIVQKLAKDYPNMPLEYWNKIKNVYWKYYYKNQTCARFPDMLRLNIINVYWQSLDLPNSTKIHLYSAYYDTRKIQTNNNYVKILVMINKSLQNFTWVDKLYCHLWYEDSQEPVISPISIADYGWRDFWKSHRDGLFANYLLGCVAPDNKNGTPKVVSVVEKPCDIANNMMRVVHNDKAQTDKFNKISVCVKGMDFLQSDISIRLVEWIEFILMMGVEKIYLYDLETHESIKKVLKYYIDKGKADLRVTTLAPGQPIIPYVMHKYLHLNIQKQLNEVIIYNDCFYRNMYDNKYIAIMDTDEIIVPRTDNNWNEMIERVIKLRKPGEYFSTMSATNLYFLDAMTPDGSYSDVPPYMHMLQHIYRSYNYTYPFSYVKSFFDTDEVILLHNHLPIVYSNRSQFAQKIPLDVGQMNHYRSSVNWDLKNKEFYNATTKDDVLWRFKDALMSRVNEALRNIDL